jgi:acyl-CoA thioesterase-1
MTQQTAQRDSVTHTLASTPVVAERPTVLFIGTSLTAGYGLQPEQAYPALVEQMADSAGTPLKAVNAGVSGETSAGALHRIAWVLRVPADIVVIETGANDALRALSVAAARANIEAIIDSVKQAKPAAKVLLVQMEAPPNLGRTYTSQFHDMYGAIAKDKGVQLIPFLLNGVAGNAELNQADGLHPNVRGERIVAHNIWTALEPVVQLFET